MNYLTKSSKFVKISRDSKSFLKGQIFFRWKIKKMVACRKTGNKNFKKSWWKFNACSKLQFRNAWFLSIYLRFLLNKSFRVNFSIILFNVYFLKLLISGFSTNENSQTLFITITGINGSHFFLYYYILFILSCKFWYFIF